jgi:hypothetical protein
MFRGVTAVAYSRQGRMVYTAGADGMVCKIDPSDGSVAAKFKSSSKAISALAVSSGMSVVKSGFLFFFFYFHFFVSLLFDLLNYAHAAFSSVIWMFRIYLCGFFLSQFSTVV